MVILWKFWEVRRSLVSGLEFNMIWCYVYDWVEEFKSQPDFISLRIVFFLEDIKLKNYTDFGYIMKVLRSKKKVG